MQRDPREENEEGNEARHGVAVALIGARLPAGRLRFLPPIRKDACQAGLAGWLGGFRLLLRFPFGEPGSLRVRAIVALGIPLELRSGLLGCFADSDKEAFSGSRVDVEAMSGQQLIDLRTKPLLQRPEPVARS